MKVQNQTHIEQNQHKAKTLKCEKYGKILRCFKRHTISVSKVSSYLQTEKGYGIQKNTKSILKGIQDTNLTRK